MLRVSVMVGVQVRLLLWLMLGLGIYFGEFC